jgi:PKD repeat protein
MRTLKLAACIIIAIAALASCKRPVASFTSDKEEYMNGEIMQMTNTSQNAKSYKWSVSNSITEYDSKDAKIITNGTGEYVVTLTAYSSNKVKTDAATKNFLVKPGAGQVMFYTSDTAVFSYNLEVDNIALGSLTNTYALPPACGATGCITTTLSEGQHTFTIVKPTMSVADVVLVDANVCKKVKMEK